MIVEALACGVPVIAYKRGVPSEIIHHAQTGYLADPDDKNNVRAKLHFSRFSKGALGMGWKSGSRKRFGGGSVCGK